MSRLASIAAVACTLLLWLAPAVSAAQDDPRLDQLLDRLQTTTDEGEAQVLTSLIWSIWLDAHDDKLNGLMEQGTRAMQVGDLEEAAADFSQVIDLAPDFAEGWNKRATVYYLLGRYDNSIADCMKVLELEPRHFGALSGLGLNYESKGDDATALAWYRKALKVNPHMPNVAKRADDLVPKVEGEPI